MKKTNYIDKIIKTSQNIVKLEAKLATQTHKQHYWTVMKINSARRLIALFSRLLCKDIMNKRITEYQKTVDEIIVKIGA